MITTLSNLYKEGLALAWMDLLVHFITAPKKHATEKISVKEVDIIKTQLKENALKIRILIQQQMFTVQSTQEAELLVRNYHSTLTILLSQASCSLDRQNFHKNPVYEIASMLLHFLDDLISMIEKKFSKYMSMNENAPVTYFRHAQKELLVRIKKLEKIVSINNLQRVPLEIMARKLNQFFQTKEYTANTSYKKIIYKKELLREVEKISFSESKFQNYTLIDTTLIYLNFNSVEYINYLISYIQEKIKFYATVEEKIKELHYLNKSFNQLHKRTDIAYKENFHCVETIINNWFTQELTYLEKFQQVVIPNSVIDNSITKNQDSNAKKQKIICMISSDQIGLILRAANDQKVLLSKSVNEIFKTIVPWLSTPSRENLSSDAMRSKSYVAESRDKKIAIETLEQIINRIKEY